MTARVMWFRREPTESPEYVFQLEDLEMLAAAIEARKPDPAAVERLRATQRYFDMERDENDRVH